MAQFNNTQGFWLLNVFSVNFSLYFSLLIFYISFIICLSLKQQQSQSMDLLVKTVIKVIVPLFEDKTATAATVILYWDPGVKLMMVKVVLLVVLLKDPSCVVH